MLTFRLLAFSKITKVLSINHINLVHFVLIALSKSLMSSLVNAFSLFNPSVGSEVVLIFADFSDSLFCFTLKQLMFGMILQDQVISLLPILLSPPILVTCQPYSICLPVMRTSVTTEFIRMLCIANASGILRCYLLCHHPQGEHICPTPLQNLICM